MPENLPFDVSVVNIINDILKINNDLVGLHRQKFQHNAAKVEIDKIIKDSKNKKIKQVLLPTVGNIFIKKNADDVDLIKLLENKAKEFENSILGIDGQITHRKQNLDEQVMRITRIFMSYLKQNGFEIPDLIPPNIEGV